MGYSTKKVREFWNENPMNYDWDNQHTNIKEGTPEFYRRIDRDFFKAESHLSVKGKPFAKIIPFTWIKGKKVLEVGCGLGSVSQLMAMHGAKVTSIDLTPRAAKNTNTRFKIIKKENPELTNLSECKALVADAQNLPFEKESFDFIISWGVIHHAPETRKCMNEIYRVLKKGGMTSGMVYHKNSIVYYGHYMFLRGILLGKLFKYSPRELADRYSDGWKRGGCPKAEHFTKKEWRNIMMNSGFKKKNIKLFCASQVTDIYLPGLRWLDKLIPRVLPNQLFKLWGWFLCWNKVRK